ncbi:DUF1501 domain-containing protein [Tautonia sp. JC769]|uniref:DUF1501 domain-containing protein n=1 Tax=Tautonia sp. JC769 TaxID=3232135 RepID=UPI00345A9F6D
MPRQRRPFAIAPTRRDVLFGLGAGLGSVALSALLADDRARAGARSPAESPLAEKPSHHAPRAKACIVLLMEGGPSHIDTFDPKPRLHDLHLAEFVRSGEEQSAMSSGTRYYVASPFTFRKAGACGADMATDWEHLAGVADELCFYRGLQAESVNHPTALSHINTGNRFGGDPAVGSWVTYGLGSENQDLPGFVVLPQLSDPQGGPANWGNGFLPAAYQGTPLRAEGSPILDLSPPEGITPEHQRANLDLLAALNQSHLEQAFPADRDELAARVASYELAFRMQATVPELLDLAGEDPRTLDLYGVGQADTDDLGRKCLMARRLVERGVRFVQLYHGTWDSHDDIARAHRSLIRGVDRPLAALVTDLKRRGLLDETLLLWCGEFGRSPDNGVRGGVAYGRDHNARAMPVWLAGGGVKAGATVGATDELGVEAVACVHPIRDLHLTLLHLLGLDDNALTYAHAGRFKQLSQFGGAVIRDVIA